MVTFLGGPGFGIDFGVFVPNFVVLLGYKIGFLVGVKHYWIRLLLKGYFLFSLGEGWGQSNQGELGWSEKQSAPLLSVTGFKIPNEVNYRPNALLDSCQLRLPNTGTFVW